MTIISAPYPIHNSEPVLRELAQWRQAALRNGMNNDEVEQQNDFILKQLEQLSATWKESHSSYFKRSVRAEGPSRAVEFLVKGSEVVVVTHCKQKGGQAPMGAGHQSIVKTSIVSLAIDLLSLQPLQPVPGTIIADKVPSKGLLHQKNKMALELEGQFIAKLAGAENIRQLLAQVADRQRKPGILLIGMQSTLKDIFGNYFVLSRNTKIAVAKDLINALKQMREKNVVHRDLHMGNCALSYDNRWVIHDFGFAQNEGQEVPVGTSINVFVSSPYILEARVFDKPSVARAVDDAWALALVLYEIDSGRKPDFFGSMVLICQALQDKDMAAAQKEYGKYVAKVAAFKTDLKTKLDKSGLVLRKVILDLLNGKDLDACSKRIEGIQSQDSEQEVTGFNSSFDSTEEQNGNGYEDQEGFDYLLGLNQD